MWPDAHGRYERGSTGLRTRNAFQWTVDPSDSGISAKRCFKNGQTMLQVTHHWVPSHKAAARLGSRSPRFWVPQKMGQKKETFSCPTSQHATHSSHKSCQLSFWRVAGQNCLLGKQIVKLEPGYAYGQSISLSFRTFYLRFL